MSSVAYAVLEVKRRLGDVNLSVPDETDVVAFLNTALRGIWNYGVAIRSPKLCKTTASTAIGATGAISLSPAPVSVKDVYDDERKRYVPNVASGIIPEWANQTGECIYGYKDTLAGVQILATSDTASTRTVKVTYWPEYEPVSRGDALPFPSSLDDVVISWTVKLISDARTQNVTDVTPAITPFVNTLVLFFEGHALDDYTGQGPW